MFRELYGAKWKNNIMCVLCNKYFLSPLNEKWQIEEIIYVTHTHIYIYIYMSNANAFKPFFNISATNTIKFGKKTQTHLL